MKKCIAFEDFSMDHAYSVHGMVVNDIFTASQDKKPLLDSLTHVLSIDLGDYQALNRAYWCLEYLNFIFSGRSRRT